jgi:prepilin-type N-terminal cleavage/methylation domain-containing protein
LRPDAPRGRAAPAGFSLIELLIAMVLSSVILLGVLAMFTAENTRISVQRELGDTWLTLRSAAELIAFDLRQVSAAGGDLTAITDSSFTVRSSRGAGVLCAKNTGASPTAAYAITSVTGDFAALVGDSVEVMTITNPPLWRVLDVASVGTPGTVGPASCVWAGSSAPTVGILFTVGPLPLGDTVGVRVGSPVRSYRSTQYGIFTSGNRRWIGRKVSGSATWEMLTGPLRTNGLTLTYYNAAGAVTTVPAQVSAVRITLRGESFGRTNKRKATQDTLTLRVQLRN